MHLLLKTREGERGERISKKKEEKKKKGRREGGGESS